MMTREEFENQTVFPLGKENTAFARYFHGQSYLNMLTTDGIVIGNVTFEPGCRNNWHIHHAKNGGGQILLVTSGCGYYQEWAEEARALHPGDTVVIPAGVKHWHGAAADSWFAHLAVEVPGEESRNEWCEPVSDEEYGKLKSAEEGRGKTAIKQTAGRDTLGEFAPKFAQLNDDVLFGEVWSRERDLSLRDRSLVTVIALMSQGLVDSSFRFHLESAKKNGLTKTEIAEILTHAAFYAGWPKAWAAFRMAKEVWAQEG